MFLQLAASAAAGLLEVQADRARFGRRYARRMKIKKMQIRRRVRWLCPIEAERFRASRAHLAVARGISSSRRQGRDARRAPKGLVIVGECDRRPGNARLIERISGLAGELSRQIRANRRVSRAHLAKTRGNLPGSDRGARS